MSKDIDFCIRNWNLCSKYGKQLLEVATTAGLDILKTASEKVIHIADEKRGLYLGNEIADKIAKRNWWWNY